MQYKRNTFVFDLIFMSWSQRSKNFSMYIKGLFLSNIVHKFCSSVKLLDIGRNWNTLSYMPIQSIPNMLNGWVCWPCKNWDVFRNCVQSNMGPCVIMLQHEVMVLDEWLNNGPQDLIMVSLCIQNAINKMHLCSLSKTYAYPWYNPTATMGHSIHNVNISKPLTHTMPYMLSAIFPVQWKPGFISEENTSPKSQMPLNVSICHFLVTCN